MGWMCRLVVHGGVNLHVLLVGGTGLVREREGEAAACQGLGACIRQHRRHAERCLCGGLGMHGTERACIRACMQAHACKHACWHTRPCMQHEPAAHACQVERFSNMANEG